MDGIGQEENILNDIRVSFINLECIAVKIQDLAGSIPTSGSDSGAILIPADRLYDVRVRSDFELQCQFWITPDL